jgi:adenosylcobyric acid synthase
LPQLGLEDEDSLSLDTSLAVGGPLSGAGNGERRLDIAVVRLPHISNFTDIDPLLAEPDTSVRYVSAPGEWGRPDAVIVPGSKNAVDDLLFLRESGLAACLNGHAAARGHVVGICGGYEMMGMRLLDPLHAESDKDEIPGLGWFPFEVTFAAEKRTERVEGFTCMPGIEEGCEVEGYEIHMGNVSFSADYSLRGDKPMLPYSYVFGQPFRLRDIRRAAGSMPGEAGQTDYAKEGCVSEDGRVWGTFVHGILHNDDFRRAWLNRLRSDRGWEPLQAGTRFKELREAAFRRLADHVRAHVDIPKLKRRIGLEETRR